MCSTLTLAEEACTRFAYNIELEGWVDLGLPVRRQSPMQVFTTPQQPDRELNPEHLDHKSN